MIAKSAVKLQYTISNPVKHSECVANGYHHFDSVEYYHLSENKSNDKKNLDFVYHVNIF